MAVPDAGLYIEFLAPDLRFAVLLLLMALSAVFALRRRPAKGFSATWLLLAFMWLAFVPWLLTTGNGRYFIPVLMLAGPLCIALIHKLPMTAAFRISAALIVIGVQGSAIALNNPWGRLPLAPWGEPYFQLNLAENERTRPAAYVTASSISYSLVAPLFASGSRWMNVASLPGDLEKIPDARRVQAFLQRAARDGLPLKAMAPTVPRFMGDDGQPTEVMRNQWNLLLGEHRMELATGQACEMAPSSTMAALARGDSTENAKVDDRKFGFWICSVRYPVERTVPRATPEDAASARIFDQLERACPRIFPPGAGVAARMRGGASRTYVASDMKVFALDNGGVFYKYWRALNPARIGSAADVLDPGFRMDCAAIRGRAGLPWEKQL